MIFSFLISFPFSGSTSSSGVASSNASGDEDMPGGGVMNSEEFIASFYGVQNFESKYFFDIFIFSTFSTPSRKKIFFGLE